MLRNHEHDAMVGRLYASALGDESWSDTLQQLADLFRSHASLLQESDPASVIVTSTVHGYSKDLAETFYASGAYAKDPRVPYFYKIRPGSVYYDHALYDVKEMLRDPWVRNSIDTLDVVYQLGAIVPLPGGSQAMLTVLKSESQGHATEGEIRSYQRLMPHIAQACALGHILECRTATQAALLDGLAHKADGIVLLNRSGSPIFMNDSAQHMFAAGDGVAYSNGVFVTHRGPETRRLQRLIGSAIAGTQSSTPGGQMLVTRPSASRPYVLRVMSAPRTDRFLSNVEIACIIHLHDLSAVHLPSHASLKAAFGLSEREADLAIELVRCANLVDAAANAQMALNTARNHLQSIFRKSATGNQVEAVQLLQRLS